MIDSALLERNQFETHLGKSFRFSIPSSAEDRSGAVAPAAPELADLSADLKLDAIQDIPAHAPPGKDAPDRQPFNLTFRGPAEPVLPQTTYVLESCEEGGGDVPVEAIFIVPLGPDGEGGMLYEAVFN